MKNPNPKRNKSKWSLWLKKTSRVGKAPRVEVIDDTTIDDLINNPDSKMLDSLQEALDSMESDMLTEGNNPDSKMLDSLQEAYG